MTQIRYITPKNMALSGPKINIGDGVYFFPQWYKPRLAQDLIPLDLKGKGNYLQFIATRDLTGDIEMGGNYTQEDVGVLGVMKQGTKLTDTEITLDNGQVLKGTLIVRVCQIDGAEQGDRYKVTLSCRFTGAIEQWGGASAGEETVAESGDVHLAKLAGPYREQATLGYQDDRIDHFARPFLIEGLDEDVVTLYDQVQAAIDAAGGDAHTYGPAASPVRVYSGTGMWAGRGVIFGMITYRRWALDCRPNKPDVVIGYIVDGYTADFTGSGSDFCFDNDIGVTASFRQRIKRRSPIQQLSYPAVFSSSPTKVMDSIVGKINSGAVNYAGDSIGAFELRADGGDLRAVDVRGTPYWYGKLTFTRRVGGWISGKAMCQRMVALPLEGNQTLPSYTLETSFRQLYAYERAGFPSLATLIPACDY